MVALAILAMIVGVSAPFLISFNNNQELDGVAEELVSILRKAQEKSMIAENDCLWGIDFSQSGKYILFNEPSGLIIPIKEEYTLPKNIVLSSNQNILKFTKLEGRINQALEVILTGMNKKYKININLEGVVDYHKID